MSERMWLAEELEQARTQRDVLRVRVKELEEVIQTQNGVVVSGTLKLNEARARVAQLEAALKDCADELEEHVEARYAKTKPHLERQYERDIEPVRQARAALKDAPQ